MKSKLVTGLIAIVVFNVAFFALCGFENPEAVWVSYGFIHIAFVHLIIAPKFVPESDDPDSFSYSLQYISIAHLVLSLIAGIVFMCLENPVAGHAVATHAIILGVAVLLFIANVKTGKKVKKRYEEEKKEASYIDDCCAKLELLKSKVKSDSELYTKIEEVYEIVHSSQIHSHKDVKELENKIISSIDNLKNEVKSQSEDAIIKKLEGIIDMVKERNVSLKYKN